jgi:hypothetical protein
MTLGERQRIFTRLLGISGAFFASSAILGLARSEIARSFSAELRST